MFGLFFLLRFDGGAELVKLLLKGVYGIGEGVLFLLGLDNFLLFVFKLLYEFGVLFLCLSQLTPEKFKFGFVVLQSLFKLRDMLAIFHSDLVLAGFRFGLDAPILLLEYSHFCLDVFGS